MLYWGMKFKLVDNVSHSFLVPPCHRSLLLPRLPNPKLFRALNQKGALVVQAEGRELAWRYVHADDIKSFGRSVCECIDSYDINSTVVTLTSGECVDKAYVLSL